MGALVRCECGKDNRLDDGLGTVEVYCIRCSRVLVQPKPRSAIAVDPSSLLLPTDEEEQDTGRHPAAALEEIDPVPHPAHPREFLYWLLPLALLPLAFSLGQPDDDTLARFHKTIENAPHDVQRKIEVIEQRPGATIDDILAVLPGKRIQGAFLPRDTALHWLFAGVATAGFLTLSAALFTGGKSSPSTLIGVGLFTATAGVVVLLAVQSVISPTYHDVLDDTGDFVISLFGYVLGVGVFEEGAKALPLWWRYRHYGPMRWRSACLWGLASGVGFGVAEGVFYAERMYNGLATADMYLVRFASCVALHAVWSASVALSLCKTPGPFVDMSDKAVTTAAALRVLAVPAVLHGLYDAMLQYHYDAGALAVAVVSFGWLAWQIEATRQACAALEPAAQPTS
jgi:RsiW-degrading membrane proteinase PrsW (M82 family)